METESSAAGYWLQQGLNGLFLATLYSVLATAYALMQGITNRIILSFGDIATVGAFAAVSMAVWAMWQGFNGLFILLPALGVAALVTSVLGRASHAGIFGPVIASTGQAVMITSIGLSIVLQELLRIQSAGRDLWLPPLFDGSLPLLDGAFPVRIGFTQLAATGISWLALLLLHLAMRQSSAGRQWRAVAQNARLAALCGVCADRVFGLTFAAASGFAGLAGAILAVTYGGVSFAMGLMLGFKAMFASIIGGFGTLSGAIVGGLFLAGLEVAWTAMFPASYRDVAVFAVIIMVLVLKPEGLVGHAMRRDHDQ